MTREQFMQYMMDENRNDYTCDYPEDKAYNLAELQVQDLERKGCDTYKPDCCDCPKAENCPLNNWEEVHPEFKDDSLTKTIKAITNRG